MGSRRRMYSAAAWSPRLDVLDSATRPWLGHARGGGRRGTGPRQGPRSGRRRQPRTGEVIAFREAVRAWFAISLQTFGGPAGQIAVMQRTLVDEKRWIGQQRFLHALNYCMLLPGPEAQQLAIYVGWLLNGVRGGLIAGILFVLPGRASPCWRCPRVYVGAGDTTRRSTALFAGLAPAVLAIVVAGGRAGRPAARSAPGAGRAGGRRLRRPGILRASRSRSSSPAPAVVGWALGPLAPATRARRRRPAPATTGRRRSIPRRRAAPRAPRPAPRAAQGAGRRAARCGAPGRAVVAAHRRATASSPTQGLFFSGTALVTFGGAYAVLAYVAQQAVEVYHWLAPGEMVRGLALAETTPGPLIMVVQFVAFLGAYRDPGSLDPWVAAVLGALLTTWVTFVPCFLFIFLGAPYVERLRGNRALSAALTGITAAVVGVIANLAVLLRPAHAVRADARSRLGAGAPGGARAGHPQLGLARRSPSSPRSCSSGRGGRYCAPWRRVPVWGSPPRSSEQPSRRSQDGSVAEVGDALIQGAPDRSGFCARHRAVASAMLMMGSIGRGQASCRHRRHHRNRHRQRHPLRHPLRHPRHRRHRRPGHRRCHLSRRCRRREPCRCRRCCRRRSSPSRRPCWSRRWRPAAAAPWRCLALRCLAAL